VRAATSGDERWWALAGRPVYDSYKNFCGFRGHGTDLTEKRRSEQQVSRRAHYVSLTGLANRVQMSQALEQILAAPTVTRSSGDVQGLEFEQSLIDDGSGGLCTRNRVSPYALAAAGAPLAALAPGKFLGVAQGGAVTKLGYALTPRHETV
jgi:predicted signal transduction protein with EAL and GGDEF domain